MLERDRNFTPITTSVVDRHVLAKGSQEKVVANITKAVQEEKPDLVVLTPTCTSSILQEDLENFVQRATLEVGTDVLLADVNHYRVNELQASDRTLLQIVNFYLNQTPTNSQRLHKKTEKPSVNIIGMLSLGFHHQHDLIELKRLFYDLDIAVNLIIPEKCSVQEIHKLPQAWFNFVPYRETGLMTAQMLKDQFNIPYIAQAPIGVLNTQEMIKKIQVILSHMGFVKNYSDYINQQVHYNSQASWFAKSIDCQNLIGKTAFVFGDSTHAAAITKILSYEMGIRVICVGTYCTHDAHWFQEEVRNFCEHIIISDDHNTIGELISNHKPDAIFGTQMERHIGKRLNIPCGVISSPVHIQNFPLSYKPFVGYEGANQIADLIYNSFTLGMEDHLLELFGGHDQHTTHDNGNSHILWTNEALQELQKIPSFIRGKVKRNTEKYAEDKQYTCINLTTMYAAKEQLS